MSTEKTKKDKKDKKEKKQKKEKVKKGGSRAYRVIYAIFAKLVSFFFRYKIVGGEKEPERSRFIVCANHVSATDPIALCYAFRKNQVRFMAKKELFKVPLLASLIKLLGAFPIDRGGSDVGAIKSAMTVVTDGGVLGIFPQGHRYPSQDPRTTKTKNGMALIATKCQADIMPVYIHRKNHKFKLFRRTYIVLGDLIPFGSLGYDAEQSGEYARITDCVFDRICTLGEEFRAELAEKKNKKNKKN